MKSDWMKFDFGSIHYEHTHSNKERTLVFLHSFNSSAASFSVVCNLLKEHFNLICLDFPGHGLSQDIDFCKYSERWSLSGLSSIFIEFVERLKIKNMVVLGNSMGGNAAVQAIPALKMMEGLILMGTIQARSSDNLFNIMFPSAPVNLLFKKTLNSQEVEVLAKAYVWQSGSEHEGFKKMRYDIAHTNGDFREYFGLSLEGGEWVDEIELITAGDLPLLYLLGQKDGFIDSPRYKKLLMECGLQESEIKILDQCGHAPHLDNPHLCAALIKEFVSN